MSLAGKRIIVTGVSSGIGQQCAKIMRQRGATIVGFDQNDPSKHVDEFIKLDLTDPASVDAAVSEFSHTVAADALCNIAGVPPTAPVSTVVTVNFIGLRYFTEQIVGHLTDGASIVNMASLAGLSWPEALADVTRFICEANFDNGDSLCKTLGVDEERSYFFSKEALIVWTLQNWNTWKHRGIRINAVSPGPVETPILPDFLESLGERAEEDMKVMGRAGTPDEVAAVVAFLCSDESRWVNGTNIPTDGGMYAHVMRQTYNF